MSNWKNKSDLNIRAAEKLIDSSLTNESVHCSYYGCVQYTYHVICNYLNIDSAYIEAETYKGDRDRDGNFDKNNATHNWLKRQIFQSLRSRESDDAEDFLQNMSILCSLRVVADYKQEMIIEKRARGLFEKAIATIEILKTNYE